jgi:hypothetical protein
MALDHRASEFLTKLMFLDLEKEAARGAGLRHIRRQAGKGSRAALARLRSARAAAPAVSSTLPAVRNVGVSTTIAPERVAEARKLLTSGSSVPAMPEAVRAGHNSGDWSAGPAAQSGARRSVRGLLESPVIDVRATQLKEDLVTGASRGGRAPASRAAAPEAPARRSGTSRAPAMPKATVYGRDPGAWESAPPRSSSSVPPRSSGGTTIDVSPTPGPTPGPRTGSSSTALVPAGSREVATTTTPAAAAAVTDGKKGASILAHLLALIGGGGIGAAAGGYAGYGAGYDMTHDTFRH